jgi:CSLREA domain-containing protein
MSDPNQTTIRIILLVTLFILFAGGATRAATLTVTKTDDTNDGVCDSDCSLREAIAAAPVGSDINFASPLFDSPQVITLSAAPGFQQLIITKTLFINGKGADLLTIRRAPSATADFRIFEVFDPTGTPGNMTVALIGLTITGGKNPNSIGGGGIRNGFSSLTLIGCVVTGNTSTLNGGGVYNASGGSLAITNCTISNNQTLGGTDGGGGIQVDSGKLTLANSTVSGNVIGQSSGGANNAGGIYVSGNVLALSVTNSTITDNQAVNPGANNAGGIYAQSALNVRDSIVAGNRNNTNVPDVAGTFTSGGFNLIGNRGAVTSFNLISDQTGTAAAVRDPLLGPLALNGARTPTHAVLPGSPALDKGNAFGFPGDQRSAARPVDNPGAPAAPGGDESDIGAYEAPRFAPLVVTKTADTKDGVCDADCSLREAIAAAPVGSEITFASPLFDTPQTITLAATAGFQQLLIDKNLTITGPGADRLTVQRDPSTSINYRVFETLEPHAVPGNVTVGLSQMKIFNGKNFSAQDGGGGIRNAYSVLNLRGCWITGNTALSNGGGIYSISGTLNIISSTISSNVTLAGDNGGGGIQVNGGNLSVTTSTVSGNLRGFNMGGVNNVGGIYFSGPSFTLTSSTVTDNGVQHPASNNFSGIYSTTTIAIGNSIVAGNRDNATLPDIRATVVTSSGFNLVGNRGSVTTLTQPTDQSGTNAAVLNPQLDPLAIYSGPTPTHRLRSTSPALDKGNAFGSTIDQRGRPRPFDIPGASNTSDGADIGSFELQAVSQFAPFANNDSYTVAEDDLLAVNAPGVLSNDTDANDDPLHAILVANPTHGTLTFTPDGSFAYRPSANYHGPDSFTYRANDGIANSSLGTVNLTVTSVNDLPAAAGDSYPVSAGGHLTVAAPGVLANDTDVDGDGLTAVLTSNPSHGTVALNANGSFTYVPQTGFTGSDSFTYQDNDGQASSNIAIVNLEINQGFKTVTKTADTNDGVCDSDCSLREAITAAASGEVIVFASPLFDSAQTITLADAAGFRTLTINKNLTIAGPGANLLTLQRLAASGPFRIFNVAGSGLTVNLQGMTITGGSDSGSGGGILNQGANTLFITGCQVAGNVANLTGAGVRNLTGTVNIIGSAIVNNRALAGTGLGSGVHSSGGSVSITNSTVSGNTNSVTAASYGGGGIWIAGGTANIASSTISDNGSNQNLSAGGILVSGGATVTVSNSIVAGNRLNATTPDVAVDNGTFVSLGFNLIGNAGSVSGFNQSTDQTGTPSARIDPKLDVLANYGGPTSTQALLPASPALDQGKSFGLNTDQRTRTRPVDSPDAPPAAGGDNADIGAYEAQTTDPFAPVANADLYQLSENLVLTVNAPGVLANDNDPNGDALSAVLVSTTAQGTLTFNADGSFVYQPAPDFVGNDSFTYRANDGRSNSTRVVVQLEVIAVNHAPHAADDSYATNENTPLTVIAPGVLGNDTDPDGNPLSAAPVSDPTSGTLKFNADGSFTYTPNPDFSGTDSFTYRAYDGEGYSDPATVAIEVVGVDQPPSAADDAYAVNSNTELSIAAPGVLANDADNDGDTLHAVLVSGASHGTLTLNADGGFNYLPPQGFVGADAFTYRANDGSNDSNIATVSIEVQQTRRTVTKTEDTNDGVCDTDCSLREAIAVARTGDEIVFASPLFDTAQTITLSDAEGFRQLLIAQPVTITGPGTGRLTIRRAPESAPFRIVAVGGPQHTVHLSGLTITGGVDDGGGGGVLVDGDNTVFIDACHITGNLASDSGGGIRNVAGNVTLTNSTISANATQSSLGLGNGIHSSGGTLTVMNSTISGNSREGTTGSVGGGGIWVSGGTASLNLSTISDNGADGPISAGGVYVSNGATVTVAGSIIAANRNNGSIPDIAADNGIFVSQGYNLIGNVGLVTDFSSAGDQTGTSSLPLDPRLTRLGDFGQPAPTHALLADSTAVNLGNPGDSSTTDERGVLRSIGARADIGAYERNFTFSNSPGGLDGAGSVRPGMTGLAYSTRFSASRFVSLLRPAAGSGRETGFAPTIELFDGSLPPGLTLDPITGLLTGTPTQPGTFIFTLKASDIFNGLAGAQQYKLVVFGPTTATVTVGGRVISTDGSGIANAQVSLTDQNGAVHLAISNGFGYYRLDSIAGGQTVVIMASAKRHRFTAQAVTLTESIDHLDLVGQ